MGFFDRRRQKREAKERERTDQDLAYLRQAIADGAADFDAMGDKALRVLVEECWEGAPTSSMQVLRQRWASNDGERTGRALYDSEFRRHWIRPDQAARADELVKLIQWHNLMRDVESDASEITVMRALLAEKVHLLGWAHDQTYGTDFVERIYQDPLQFGIHKLQG